MGRRAYLLIAGFALLLVLFPFLFWYGTWFGRRLTDAQIDSYLIPSAKPRQAQHALVQIGERMARGDVSARRWYPKVIECSTSPVLELRQTAAWIMGQDHGYEPFHEPLRHLLEDPEPTVRRNAALSLSNFRDPAARPALLAMLRPFSIVSGDSGPLKFRLKEGEYVNRGTLVGRVGDHEVRSPVPGEVRAFLKPDSSTVKAGEPLVELSPDKDHAWEALRALVSIGEAEDLEDIRRYTRPFPGTSERLRQQAANTIQAIESRAH